jgi:hypothetical protein
LAKSPPADLSYRVIRFWPSYRCRLLNKDNVVLWSNYDLRIRLTTDIFSSIVTAIGTVLGNKSSQVETIVLPFIYFCDSFDQIFMIYMFFKMIFGSSSS